MIAYLARDIPVCNVACMENLAHPYTYRVCRLYDIYVYIYIYIRRSFYASMFFCIQGIRIYEFMHHNLI